MLYPIAIEVGNEQETYGIVFPDLPGCFSAGESLEDALANSREAVEFYLEDLAENDKIPPTPKSLSYWQKDPEFLGWAWSFIEIDTEPYMGKSQKINVTLPSLLIKKIDDEVKLNPTKYSSRSHFLQVVSINQLTASK
ncbi:type II toxin-antitoxin system HicB family antitoxin [Vibrio harveyi]|nr:type II toxin-antitoxin system HicB family antitoxin [Vibrio harveyi]